MSSRILIPRHLTKKTMIQRIVFSVTASMMVSTKEHNSTTISMIPSTTGEHSMRLSAARSYLKAFEC